MRRVILAVGLLPFLVAAKVASGSVAELSLAQLEDRVEEIDRKLTARNLLLAGVP